MLCGRWSQLPSKQQHAEEFWEVFGMRCCVCTHGGICILHAEMMERYKSDQAAVVTAMGAPDFISCLKPEGVFCMWNASRRSSLGLRTSSHMKHLSSRIQGEDSFYLVLWPFFLQIYGNLGLLCLQSFQPQSWHNYFTHLCKPYDRNTGVSCILECICPYVILLK